MSDLLPGIDPLPFAEPEFGAMVPALAGGRVVELAHRLGLSASEVTASEAVEMLNGNAATVGIVILNLEALSKVDIVMELSNDRQGWWSAISTSLRRAGYSSVRAVGIAARFVRLRYTGVGASGTAILAALVKPWRT